MRPLDLMFFAAELHADDGPGTVNVVSRNLARELRRLGHRIRLVTNSSEPKPDVLIDAGTVLSYLVADSEQEISDLVRRFERPDVLHAFDWDAAQVGIAASQEWGVPLFASPLTLPLRPTDADTRAVARQAEVADRAKLLFAPSQFAANKTIVRCGVDARKSIVIPPGVDSELFRPRRDLEPKPQRPFVLAADRKSRAQVEFWLDSMAAIPSNHRPLLVTTGTTPETQELAAERGVETIFWAPASQVEFAATVRQASAVLVPNVDAVSLLALEAQASGVPVLAGADGGASEVVVDGETGYLIDTLDPVRWAEPVLALLRNQQEAKRLSRNGRAFALEHPWGRPAAKFEELYYTNRHVIPKPSKTMAPRSWTARGLE